MTRVLLKIIFLFSLTLFVIQPILADAAPAIKIGCLYPMTGRGGRYGLDSKIAAEMAADEINAKGGVNGRKIELVFTDEQSTDISVRTAERYITQDKVNFIMGVVSSAVGLAVTEVSKRHKVIFIGTDHASTALTIEKFQPYYFRVSNNTYQSMKAAYLYAKDKPWKKYYVLGPDYEYGHRQWEDFWGHMSNAKKDLQVLGEAWPKLYEPDYTPYITAIMRAKPEVLVATTWGGDTVAFIKQAIPYGLFKQIQYFNCDAGGNYEVMEALGDSMPADLILSARHHLNWPDTEYNRRFVEEFRKRSGGKFPSYAAEGAYAGVLFVAEAVKAAGTAEDSDKLVKVMETLKIKLPEDPDGFTSYMRPIDHQIVQVQAIGVSEPNTKYPPAKFMLGKFQVFKAEDIIPSEQEILDLRKKAGTK
jgi:branched-chain amino acid transport system substrate-binding protein